MSKQDKGKPIFGLCKLPAQMLLKASRQEVGELKAYVDELEYSNKNLQEQLDKLIEDNKKLLELNQHYNNSRCDMVEELEQLKLERIELAVQIAGLREDNESMLATLERIKEIAEAAQEE